MEGAMSEVIPFPGVRARLQPIRGHMVLQFDADLKDGVIGILHQADDAGGVTVVGALLANLVMEIKAEFGTAALAEARAELNRFAECESNDGIPTNWPQNW